jgi:hypothetical protein
VFSTVYWRTNSLKDANSLSVIALPASLFNFCFKLFKTQLAYR